MSFSWGAQFHAGQPALGRRRLRDQGQELQFVRGRSYSRRARSSPEGGDGAGRTQRRDNFVLRQRRRQRAVLGIAPPQELVPLELSPVFPSPTARARLGCFRRAVAVRSCVCVSPSGGTERQNDSFLAAPRPARFASSSKSAPHPFRGRASSCEAQGDGWFVVQMGGTDRSRAAVRELHSTRADRAFNPVESIGRAGGIRGLVRARACSSRAHGSASLDPALPFAPSPSRMRRRRDARGGQNRGEGSILGPLGGWVQGNS